MLRLYGRKLVNYFGQLVGLIVIPGTAELQTLPFAVGWRGLISIISPLVDHMLHFTALTICRPYLGGPSTNIEPPRSKIFLQTLRCPFVATSRERPLTQNNVEHFIRGSSVAGNAKVTSVPQVDGGHWHISKCGRASRYHKRWSQ